MKKWGYLAVLFLGCWLMMPMNLRAEERFVVDQADLLSEQEEQAIEEKAQELSEAWNQDFVIVTTLDAEGKDSEAYADDYYDDHGYRKNGVLYLVDKDNNNVWISTSGAMIRFLTDERIERVIDAGYEELRMAEYGNGFLKMLEQTENYMEEGIPGNQYTYDVETGAISRYRSITMMEAMLALAAAAAGGLICFFSIKSSYKMKHGAYSYPFQAKGQVDLVQKDDHFINQVVTRKKIPQNNSSGGSGGGRSSVHTSGSGSSHGGGGRSL